MPLVIKISSFRVEIPAHHLSFPFVPPQQERLRIAQETLTYLQYRTEQQNQVSEAEKEQTHIFLQSFGLTLFQCLFPSQKISSLIKRSDAICLSFQDKRWEHLPWELLYSPKWRSYLIITPGLYRHSLLEGFNPLPLKISQNKPFIRAALFSSFPDFNQYCNHSSTVNPLGSFFPFNAEGVLPLKKNLLENPVHWYIRNSTKKEDLLKRFDDYAPHLWFFSGFCDEENWFLEDINKGVYSLSLSSLHKILFPFIKNGLQFVILRLRLLEPRNLNALTPQELTEYLKKNEQVRLQHAQSLLTLGIENLIILNSDLSSEKIVFYIKHFCSHLNTLDSFQAHKRALGELIYQEKLNWDWLSIIYYGQTNSSVLNVPSTTEQERDRFLENFPLCPERKSFLEDNIFNESRSILNEIEQKIFQEKHSIVYLTTNTNQPLEHYVHEMIRRIPQEIPIEIEYFQPWMNPEEEFANNNDQLFFNKIRHFFFSEEDTPSLYESFILKPIQEENPKHRFLIINNGMPQSPYTQQWFDEYSIGKTILALQFDSNASGTQNSVHVDQMNSQDILKTLPSLPPELRGDIEPKLFKHTFLFNLFLKLRLNDPLSFFRQENSTQKLFQELHLILNNMEIEKMHALFLIGGRLPREILQDVFDITQNKKDLTEELLLITSSADHLQSGIHQSTARILEQNNFFDEKILLPTAKKLLSQFLNSDIDESQINHASQAFFTILETCKRYKFYDMVAEKLILFCRKHIHTPVLSLALKKYALGSAFFYAENNNNARILHQNIKFLTQESWFQELQPSERQEIYLTLLNDYLQIWHNWYLFTSVRSRLAYSYSLSGKKDQAQALLAQNLNFIQGKTKTEEYYESILELALGHIQIKDFRGLRKIVQDFQYDFSKLNRIQQRNFWIIYGYLCADEQKIEEEKHAFKKALEDTPEQALPNTWDTLLWDKTLESGQKKQKIPRYQEISRRCRQATKRSLYPQYEKRWLQYCLDHEDYQAALEPAELLYQDATEAEAKKEYANVLGKIHHKLSNKDPLDHFYKTPHTP